MPRGRPPKKLTPKYSRNAGPDSQTPDIDRNTIIAAAEVEKEIESFLADSGNLQTDFTSYLSTGSMVFDRILGGGFPQGGIVEMTSEEGVGKTSLLIDTALNLQKQGIGSVIFDCERGWNEKNLRDRGGRVNTKEADTILLGRYETAEDVDVQFQRLVRAPNFKFFVIDSLQGMTPEAILTGELGKIRPGLVASINQDFLVRAMKSCQRFHKAAVVVTQLRSKFNFDMFSKEKSGPDAAGGWAMKFFASIRAYLTRKSQITEKQDLGPLLDSDNPVPIGHWVECVTFKNRHTSPYRKGYAFLRYGEGFDNYQTIFELAKDVGLVNQIGGGYQKFELKSGTKNVQGFAAARNFVKDNIDEILMELKEKGLDLGV